MLFKDTIKLALPFGQHIFDSHKRLAVATSGSILNELVAKSIPALTQPKDVLNVDKPEPVLTADEQEQFFLQVESTTGAFGEASQHTAAMDTSIEALSKVVQKHIAHARGVVLPMVESFASKYTEALGHMAVPSAADGFDIQKQYLPAPLTDEAFVSSLSAYADLTPKIPKEYLDLNDANEETLRTYVKTGSKRVDEQIDVWLTQKPEGFLSAVWYGIFTKREYVTTVENKVVTSYEEVLNKTPYDSADIALAIFLIANNYLTNEIPPEYKKSVLSVYKNRVADIRDFAGGVLTKVLKDIAFDHAARSGGKLILSMTGKEIKVDGLLYDAWLQKGGSPEVILGRVISGERTGLTYLFQIEQASEDLKKRWHAYEVFHHTKQVAERSANQKTLLNTLVLELFQTTPEDGSENELLAKVPNFKEVNCKKTLEYIESLYQKDLNDPYDLALMIVAKYRFCYTSAYDMLYDMHKASEQLPDCQPRELALIAAINYVADFLADQIALK